MGKLLLLIGAAVIAVSHMIAGHRLHRWLWHSLPSIGQRLPTDIGAWIGLAVGLVVAYLAFLG